MERDVSIRELRATLADVVNRVAVHGEIAFVTSRGRRVAAVVPLRLLEELKSGNSGSSSA